MMRFLLFFLYISVILLLVSGAASFLPPAKWWPVALLGNFFPVFYLAVFILTIILAIKKRGHVLLGASALLITLPGVLRIVPVRISGGVKEKSDLTVMTWNTGLMNYSAPDKETAIARNKVIFDQIRNSKADIVCLQEFFTAVIPDTTYNFIDKIKAMGYPYHFFSRDNPKFDKKFYSGSILFSKFPLVDSSRHPFGIEPSASLIRAGILFRNDTIDVITGHFQNISYEQEDNGLNIKVGKLSKLKQGFSDQQVQAKVIRNIYRSSGRPRIFCGDLNAISTSYLYRKVKQDMNDAWLHGGFGFGSTFHSRIPGLRIDYIFSTAELDCTGARTITTSSSDHDAVLATFNKK